MGKNEVVALTMIHCITFLLFLSTLPSSFSEDKPKNFIIHVSKVHKPSTFTSHHHWYNSILSTLPPPHHSKKLLYTYQHVLHGFSAHLTNNQADTLRYIHGILKVTRGRISHIRTTRTPTFLGLTESHGLWPNSDYADDVIIGLLDTGIWPESRSFNDAGLSPIPAKWKGGCVSTADFPVSACNKKLIGAKFYSLGYEAEMGREIGNKLGESRSPRDTEGHGTHTASTAAGSVVQDVGFYDLARGEARGMAIKAKLAMYKVCWEDGCSDIDTIAAMDDAVGEGVDVISVSVSPDWGADYYEDSFAIAAFGAVASGILVSCVAGNSGPKGNPKGEMVNVAPWILTVGASSIDRDFQADVVLGDGSVYRGISVYSNTSIGSNLPIVYAKNHGHRLCPVGGLKNVEGKIVLCDGGGNSNLAMGIAVKRAGGAGMIIASKVNTAPGGPGDLHLLPATVVDPAAGDKVRKYINDTRELGTASIIFRGTVYDEVVSPKVYQLSSRGPNEITPSILKPDLIAPGVNILAAWSPVASPSEEADDSRRVEFNIQSGTSMATPHVSGIAAMLRRAYPSWSSAAIKSALMTTAYNVDNTGNSIIDFVTGKESTPFDHGSGHVDPNKALDPGLVYDLNTNDYIGFLCSIGYDSSQIVAIVQDRSFNCSTMTLASPGDLNYPSFSVVLKASAITKTVTHKRVLTNVGKSINVVYDVKVSIPSSIDIVVSPNRLVFGPQSQSLSYEVTFSVLSDDDTLPQFGWIEWSDGFHKVRSPIAVSYEEEDIFSM